MIGLVLIMLIVVVFSILNAPTREELMRQKQIQDSIAKSTQLKETVTGTGGSTSSLSSLIITSDSGNTLLLSDSMQQIQREQESTRKYGSFANLIEGEEQMVKVENEKMILYFTTRGAYPKKVVLKEYQTYYKEPLVLYHPDSSWMDIYFFNEEGKEIHTSELYFQPSHDSIYLQGEKSGTITFTAVNRKNQEFKITYEFKGNDYLLNYDIESNDWTNMIDQRLPYVYFSTHLALLPKEKYLQNQRYASTVYFKFKGEDVDYLSERSSEEKEPDASILWVALKDQFFSVIFYCEDFFDKTDGKLYVIDEEHSGFAKKMGFQLTKEVVGSDSRISTKMYFGPNHYQTLKKYGYEFERIIPLGWSIIGWVNRFLVIPIFNFLETLHLSYGIIILILTLIIKLILSPITYRNYVSAAKMRVLKPDIEEINRKYANDAMKKQQAIMELYRKSGVNPLAGCIPMLLQLPILYAMFRFFPASIELRQESFLWADDLSTYDSILDLPFNIPFYGDHISLFTLLMAISIYFYTKVNSSSMDTSGNDIMAQQMKIMMYLMPFMMLFFFNNFSAGLTYYYFIANVTSILQTFAIRKWVINEAAIRRQIEENKKRPLKKSAWQIRLEEMAKKRSMPR